MNQERAIQLMRLEMKVECVEKLPCAIPEKYHWLIAQKMKRIFAAGFDDGYETSESEHTWNNIKIIQFDSDWNQIGEFDSQVKASKAVHYTSRKILRALKSGKKTCEGHYWRYADELQNVG